MVATIFSPTVSNKQSIYPGWFWSGSGVTIPATNKTAVGWTDNPWSNTGMQ